MLCKFLDAAILSEENLFLAVGFISIPLIMSEILHFYYEVLCLDYFSELIRSVVDL